MKVADGLTVANQLSLRWQIILGYLGGPSRTRRVFISGRRKQKKKNQRLRPENLSLTLLVLKMEEGAMSQGILYKLEKVREQTLP